MLPMRPRDPTPVDPDGRDEPHDVLAAEEFAMPAPEVARRDRPLALPEDPSGETEPHDILAAEEFAMPAPPPRAPFAPRGGRRRD
jgi:hypothetical protein